MLEKVKGNHQAWEEDVLGLLLRRRLLQELADTGWEQVAPGSIQPWNSPPWVLTVAPAEDGWSRRGWRGGRSRGERREEEHSELSPV